MAYTTFFNRTETAGTGRRILNGVAQAMTRYMERQSRTDQIQRLQAKSDAELAHMGLRRDDIVRHVFRDRFHV